MNHDHLGCLPDAGQVSDCHGPVVDALHHVHPQHQLPGGLWSRLSDAGAAPPPSLPGVVWPRTDRVIPSLSHRPTTLPVVSTINELLIEKSLYQLSSGQSCSVITNYTRGTNKAGTRRRTTWIVCQSSTTGTN